MNRSGKASGRSGRSADSASAIAVAGLTYLAADPARLSRFLALTGLEAAAIRTAAREPGFLAGVLEYLAGDEALLLAFAAEAGLAPGEIDQARHILSGGVWEREIP
jgi:hypothetical protein